MTQASDAERSPVIIKKYANRRLYNTGNSTYVTLEDLAEMVKKGEDFVVFDAKSSEDITRSVLTQIIFEQEAKVGQSLLPITFMRQLIRFYGDSMQMVVPSYLEFSIDKLVADQHKFRDQITQAFAGSPFTPPGTAGFAAIEEQTRKNLALFQDTFNIFNPFRQPRPVAASQTPKTSEDDLDSLRKEFDQLQKRLDRLTKPTE